MSSDPFASTGRAEGGGLRPPTVAQLGSGAGTRVRTYATGTDAEVTNLSTKGRLVSLTPVSVTRGLPSPSPGKTQDRMEVDIVVFDGEPIADVLDKDGEAVFTPEEPWVAPFRLARVYISQVMLVGQLEKHLKNKTTAIGILGKLPKNANGYRAWVILDPTDEERAAAAPVFTKLQPNPFAED